MTFVVEIILLTDLMFICYTQWMSPSSCSSFKPSHHGESLVALWVASLTDVPFAQTDFLPQPGNSPSWKNISNEESALPSLSEGSGFHVSHQFLRPRGEPRPEKQEETGKVLPLADACFKWVLIHLVSFPSLRNQSSPRLCRSKLRRKPCRCWSFGPKWQYRNWQT